MKRKFLFLMALAMIFGMSSANAADLPTSGSGEFFLKNVGTGTYLKGDAYYGTKVVVWNDPYSVTLTYVSDNIYTIKTQQNNGGDNQYVTGVEDPYVDGAAANMTFTSVDNKYYYINNGAGNLYATTITEDGATFYKVMAGTETSDYAKWEVISREEMEAALDNANSSTPVDATFFIADAGIDVKSVNESKWTASKVDFGGGGNAGHSAESWNKDNFSISQTVTGLPNGKYKVTCYGYYRYNTGGDNNNKAAIAAHEDGSEKLNAIFYAGTKETPLMSVAGDENAMNFCSTMNWDDNTPNQQYQAAACFTQGFYLNTIEDVIVTDGTLTIGVKKETQAGTDWAVFDEFKLYYYGEDLSIYEDALAAAKEAANAASTSQEPMHPSVMEALKTAIATNGSKEFSEYSKVEDITADIAALNAATEAVKTSIANYEAALAILKAASNFDADGQASYEANDAIIALQEAYDKRTLEAVTPDQENACAEALRIAAKAQTTNGADLTLAIINPGFETGDLTGWTNSNNFVIQNNGEKIKVGNFYAEYYSSGGFTNTQSITQTIPNLPAGTYILTADAVSRNTASVKVLAADNEADVTIDNTPRTYSIVFTCDETKDVVIGFQGTGSGASDSWIGVDNFTLTLVKSVTVNVTDAGYATFSAECALDLSDIKDGKAYIALKESDGETITLEECKGIVPANTGLVIAGEGNVEISIASANAETIDVEENLLVATDGTEVEAGNYVLAATKDTNENVGFYVLNAAKTIEAGKAYLMAKAVPNGNAAKAIRIVFGDENATAIEAVATEAEAEGALYNVAGQQVGKDYKGIVIKNGKKYLNK